MPAQRIRLLGLAACIRHETRVHEELVALDSRKVPAVKAEYLIAALTDYLAALRQLNHWLAVCGPLPRENDR